MFFQLKNSEEAPVMGKLLEAIPFYEGSGENDSLFRMYHFSSKCLPDSNNLKYSIKFSQGAENGNFPQIEIRHSM
jgi:hypothetical protein